MLPEGKEIAPFEREGRKPLLTRLDGGEKRHAQIVADIAAFRAAGFDSIAVITKTAAESREAYESLRIHGGEALQLITKGTLDFEKGVMVIPAYLAKGVEFDAVWSMMLRPELIGGKRTQASLYGVYAGHAPASSLHDGRMVAVRAGIACEFV